MVDVEKDVAGVLPMDANVLALVKGDKELVEENKKLTSMVEKLVREPRVPIGASATVVPLVADPSPTQVAAVGEHDHTATKAAPKATAGG